jgi:hypothetical protein
MFPECSRASPELDEAALPGGVHEGIFSNTHSMGVSRLLRFINRVQQSSSTKFIVEVVEVVQQQSSLLMSLRFINRVRYKLHGVQSTEFIVEVVEFRQQSSVQTL